MHFAHLKSRTRHYLALGLADYTLNKTHSTFLAIAQLQLVPEQSRIHHLVAMYHKELRYYTIDLQALLFIFKLSQASVSTVGPSDPKICMINLHYMG